MLALSHVMGVQDGRGPPDGGAPQRVPGYSVGWASQAFARRKGYRPNFRAERAADLSA